MAEADRDKGKLFRQKYGNAKVNAILETCGDARETLSVEKIKALLQNTYPELSEEEVTFVVFCGDCI